jgi:uncharacterized protein
MRYDTAVRTIPIVLLAAIGCGKGAARSHDAARSFDAAPPTPAVDAAIGAAAVAQRFVTHLGRGEYEAALALLPPEAAGKVDAARLRTDWTGAAGEVDLVGVTVDPWPGGPDRFRVRARLGDGATLDVVVAIDGDRIARSRLGQRYAPPAYVDLAAFDDRPVAVGTGAAALPGELSVPRSAGPHPVVILIHGSGPHDLDSTIGPAKPLRDLAWGLASQGVAVLRYDKRTYGEHVLALGVDPAAMTVHHEYLDDAAAAIAGVAARPEIDPARIYVLGHSQGGWLTPWILRDNPKVRGGIIASGNAGGLADLLPRQYEYLARVGDDVVDAFERAAIEQVEKQVARAVDPDLALDTPATELPLGIPAPYWKALHGYDAPAVAAALDGRRWLLLQGGHDYQVTDEDHAVWKRALDGADVTARHYPALNHIYVPTDAMATPAYVMAGGHVDPAVIGDVAAWVTAR